MFDMITFELLKLDQAGYKCDYIKCTHNPEYHWNVIGNSFNLKIDQTVLIVHYPGSWEIYCRDCVDIFYRKAKPLLDSKLWIFK